MRRVDWLPRMASPVPHDAGRELLLDQVPDLPRLRAGSSHEVAGVPRRLVQEAGAGQSIVDLRLGAPAGPVLRESGRELRVQLGARIIGQQLVGHVSLSFRGHGVGDGLVRFRSGVEVQQGRDDLVVDLAAVVVARQRRGDGRAHLAAGLVVRQLAGHEARHLALVPVGHQLSCDERQHLGLRPVLREIQRVERRGDCSSGFELRVSFGSGVGVGLDEDRVVQVLEGGGGGSRHGEVPQHVAAPQLQIEGRSAGPGLAVAQGDGHQGGCDGRLDLRYRPVGAEIDGGPPRRDGAVGLRRGVVARERCSYRCVPLDDGPVGHQCIGDGLRHLRRGAVVGQLRVRVILGLGDGSARWTRPSE